MFSIYSSAFNIIKNDFEYGLFIDKFCEFAEEVVIAVNKSEVILYALSLLELQVISSLFNGSILHSATQSIHSQEVLVNQEHLS